MKPIFAKMYKVLAERDDSVTGGDLKHATKAWIETGLTPESVSEWLDAGVWNPDSAVFFTRHGLTPSEVVELAEYLIETYSAEEFTDGCPIYAVCNADVNPKLFLRAEKLRERSRHG